MFFHNFNKEVIKLSVKKNLIKKNTYDYVQNLWLSEWERTGADEEASQGTS